MAPEAPQAAARPYLVFSRQDTVSLATLAGPATHWDVQVAVMAFAETPTAAIAVANAARNRLDGYQTDSVIRGCRMIDRSQQQVSEPEAEPVLIADAMLFRMMSASP